MEEMNGNVSGEVVSPQETSCETSTDTTMETTFTGESNEVVAEPQNVEETVDNVEQSIPQSQEENSRFAKLRRESEMRGMDRAIAEMGLEWQGQPITSYSQYQRALKEQKLMEEAQNNNIDPKFYVDFKNMQEELQGYRQEKTFMEQDRELSNDVTRGQFYNQWKDEIRDMATNYGVDLRTAFTLTLENRLGDILNNQAQKIQNETIKKINENRATSVGSLSEQGDNPSFNAWDMTSEEFNKYIQKVKNR